MVTSASNSIKTTRYTRNTLLYAVSIQRSLKFRHTVRSAIERQLQEYSSWRHRHSSFPLNLACWTCRIQQNEGKFSDFFGLIVCRVHVLACYRISVMLAPLPISRIAKIALTRINIRLRKVVCRKRTNARGHETDNMACIRFCHIAFAGLTSDSCCLVG